MNYCTSIVVTVPRLYESKHINLVSQTRGLQLHCIFFIPQMKCVFFSLAPQNIKSNFCQWQFSVSTFEFLVRVLCYIYYIFDQIRRSDDDLSKLHVIATDHLCFPILKAELWNFLMLNRLWLSPCVYISICLESSVFSVNTFLPGTESDHAPHPIPWLAAK